MTLTCTLDDARNRIETLKSYDVFAVVLNGLSVGIVGCPPINKAKSEYGLFYQFRKSVWGLGYATIATSWLISFMKEKYPEVTLFADVIVDNIASEKILQRKNCPFGQFFT